MVTAGSAVDGVVVVVSGRVITEDVVSVTVMEVSLGVTGVLTEAIVTGGSTTAMVIATLATMATAVSTTATITTIIITTTMIDLRAPR